MYLMNATPFAKTLGAPDFSAQAQRSVYVFLFQNGFPSDAATEFAEAFAARTMTLQSEVRCDGTPWARRQLREILVPTVSLYEELLAQRFTVEQAQKLTVSFLYRFVYARAEMLQRRMLSRWGRYWARRVFSRERLATLSADHAFSLRMRQQSQTVWEFELRSCLYRTALNALNQPWLLRHFCDLNKIYFGACWAGLTFRLRAGQTDERWPCVFTFQASAPKSSAQKGAKP